MLLIGVLYAFLPYSVAFGVGHVKAACRASAGLKTLKTVYVSSFGKVEKENAANFSSLARLGGLRGAVWREGSGAQRRRLEAFSGGKIKPMRVRYDFDVRI